MPPPVGRNRGGRTLKIELCAGFWGRSGVFGLSWVVRWHGRLVSRSSSFVLATAMCWRPRGFGGGWFVGMWALVGVRIERLPGERGSWLWVG